MVTHKHQLTELCLCCVLKFLFSNSGPPLHSDINGYGLDLIRTSTRHCCCTQVPSHNIHYDGSHFTGISSHHTSTGCKSSRRELAESRGSRNVNGPDCQSQTRVRSARFAASASCVYSNGAAGGFFFRGHAGDFNDCGVELVVVFHPKKNSSGLSTELSF